MSVSSRLCPCAVRMELLPYPCCKIQNYLPVNCPSDYEKCPVFENRKKNNYEI